MKKIKRIKAVIAEEGIAGKWLTEQVGRDLIKVLKWCDNTSQQDFTTLNIIAEALNVDMKDSLCRKTRISIKN